MYNEPIQYDIAAPHPFLTFNFSCRLIFFLKKFINLLLFLFSVPQTIK